MITTRMPRLALALAWFGAAGCGAPPADPVPPPAAVAPGTDAPRPAADDSRSPADAAPPATPRATRPDVTRLAYHADKRTLTLYPLAEQSGRWMLAVPGRPRGVPVDGEYEFPPSMDFDLDQVRVFYTVADRRPSPAVTLREILDAHDGRLVR